LVAQNGWAELMFNMEGSIKISKSREEDYLSVEGARMIAGAIRGLVAVRGLAVVLLDGSRSLTGCYYRLREEPLPWTQVVGLQLSEWRSNVAGGAGSARNLIVETLVKGVPMAEFHELRGDAANPTAVCTNYEELLGRRRPDLAVVAVGADGQIGTPPLSNEMSDLNGNTAGGRGSRLVTFCSESIGLRASALLGCTTVLAFGGCWPAEFDHPGLVHLEG